MSSFLRTTFAPVALLMISASVVGCGSGTKSTTVVIEQPPGGQGSFLTLQARGQDADAKSNARNMVAEVESCAAYHAGEYTDCATAASLSNTAPTIGSGPGQVEIQISANTNAITA